MITTHIRLGQKKKGKLYWMHIIAEEHDGRDCWPETFTPTGRSSRATKFKYLASAKSALERARNCKDFYHDTLSVDEPGYNDRSLKFARADWRCYKVTVEETYEELVSDNQ